MSQVEWNHSDILLNSFKGLELLAAINAELTRRVGEDILDTTKINQMTSDDLKQMANQIVQNETVKLLIGIYIMTFQGLQQKQSKIVSPTSFRHN